MIWWTSLSFMNNLKAPFCFLLLHRSRTNARNYGPQTEVDGDRTITYYSIMSISKFVEAKSRTLPKTSNLNEHFVLLIARKWYEEGFFQVRTMSKNVYIERREYEREGFPCLDVAYKFKIYMLMKSVVWPTPLASGHSTHVRQHNPQAPTVSKQEKLHHRK